MDNARSLGQYAFSKAQDESHKDIAINAAQLTPRNKSLEMQEFERIQQDAPAAPVKFADDVIETQRELYRKSFVRAPQQTRTHLPQFDVTKEKALRADRRMGINVLYSKLADLRDTTQDEGEKAQAKQTMDWLADVQGFYEQQYAKDPLEANGFLQKMVYGAADSIIPMGKAALGAVMKEAVADIALGAGMAIVGAAIPEPTTTAAGIAVGGARIMRASRALFTGWKSVKKARTMSKAARAAFLAANFAKHKAAVLSGTRETFGRAKYGEMYMENEKAGMNPEINRKYSRMGGFAEALIESLISPADLLTGGGVANKAAGKAFRSLFRNNVRAAAAAALVGRTAHRVLGEMSEEGAQEISGQLFQHAAEKAQAEERWAKALIEGVDKEMNNPKYVVLDKWDVMQDGWNAFKESVWAVGGLSAFGIGADVSVGQYAKDKGHASSIETLRKSDDHRESFSDTARGEASLEDESRVLADLVGQEADKRLKAEAQTAQEQADALVQQEQEAEEQRKVRTQAIKDTYTGKETPEELQALATVINEELEGSIDLTATNLRGRIERSLGITVADKKRIKLQRQQAEQAQQAEEQEAALSAATRVVIENLESIPATGKFTINELMKATGLSRREVVGALDVLKERGAIEETGRKGEFRKAAQPVPPSRQLRDRKTEAEKAADTDTAALRNAAAKQREAILNPPKAPDQEFVQPEEANVPAEHKALARTAKYVDSRRSEVQERIKATDVAKALKITLPEAREHLNALAEHGVVQKIKAGYGFRYEAMPIERSDLALEEGDIRVVSESHSVDDPVTGTAYEIAAKKVDKDGNEVLVVTEWDIENGKKVGEGRKSDKTGDDLRAMAQARVGKTKDKKIVFATTAKLKGDKSQQVGLGAAATTPSPVISPLSESETEDLRLAEGKALEQGKSLEDEKYVDDRLTGLTVELQQKGRLSEEEQREMDGLLVAERILQQKETAAPVDLPPTLRDQSQREQRASKFLYNEDASRLASIKKGFKTATGDTAKAYGKLVKRAKTIDELDTLLYSAHGKKEIGSGDVDLTDEMLTDTAWQEKMREEGVAIELFLDRAKNKAGGIRVKDKVVVRDSVSFIVHLADKTRYKGTLEFDGKPLEGDQLAEFLETPENLELYKKAAKGQTELRFAIAWLIKNASKSYTLTTYLKALRNKVQRAEVVAQIRDGGANLKNQILKEIDADRLIRLDAKYKAILEKGDGTTTDGKTTPTPFPTGNIQKATMLKWLAANPESAKALQALADKAAEVLDTTHMRDKEGNLPPIELRKMKVYRFRDRFDPVKPPKEKQAKQKKVDAGDPELSILRKLEETDQTEIDGRTIVTTRQFDTMVERYLEQHPEEEADTAALRKEIAEDKQVIPLSETKYAPNAAWRKLTTETVEQRRKHVELELKRRKADEGKRYRDPDPDAAPVDRHLVSIMDRFNVTLSEAEEIRDVVDAADNAEKVYKKPAPPKMVQRRIKLARKAFAKLARLVESHNTFSMSEFMKENNIVSRSQAVKILESRMDAGLVSWTGHSWKGQMRELTARELKVYKKLKAGLAEVDSGNLSKPMSNPPFRWQQSISGGKAVTQAAATQQVKRLARKAGGIFVADKTSSGTIGKVVFGKVTVTYIHGEPSQTAAGEVRQKGATYTVFISPTYGRGSTVSHETAHVLRDVLHKPERAAIKKATGIDLDTLEGDEAFAQKMETQEGRRDLADSIRRSTPVAKQGIVVRAINKIINFMNAVFGMKIGTIKAVSQFENLAGSMENFSLLLGGVQSLPAPKAQNRFTALLKNRFQGGEKFSRAQQHEWKLKFLNTIPPPQTKADEHALSVLSQASPADIETSMTVAANDIYAAFVPEDSRAQHSLEEIMKWLESFEEAEQWKGAAELSRSQLEERFFDWWKGKDGLRAHARAMAELIEGGTLPRFQRGTDATDATIIDRFSESLLKALDFAHEHAMRKSTNPSVESDARIKSYMKAIRQIRSETGDADADRFIARMDQSYADGDIAGVISNAEAALSEMHPGGYVAPADRAPTKSRFQQAKPKRAMRPERAIKILKESGMANPRKAWIADGQQGSLDAWMLAKAKEVKDNPPPAEKNTDLGRYVDEKLDAANKKIKDKTPLGDADTALTKVGALRSMAHRTRRAYYGLLTDVAKLGIVSKELGQRAEVEHARMGGGIGGTIEKYGARYVVPKNIRQRMKDRVSLRMSDRAGTPSNLKASFGEAVYIASHVLSADFSAKGEGRKGGSKPMAQLLAKEGVAKNMNRQKIRMFIRSEAERQAFIKALDPDVRAEAERLKDVNNDLYEEVAAAYQKLFHTKLKQRDYYAHVYRDYAGEVMTEEQRKAASMGLMSLVVGQSGTDPSQIKYFAGKGLGGIQIVDQYAQMMTGLRQSAMFMHMGGYAKDMSAMLADEKFKRFAKHRLGNDDSLFETWSKSMAYSVESMGGSFENRDMTTAGINRALRRPLNQAAKAFLFDPFTSATQAASWANFGGYFGTDVFIKGNALRLSKEETNKFIDAGWGVIKYRHSKFAAGGLSNVIQDAAKGPHEITGIRSPLDAIDFAQNKLMGFTHFMDASTVRRAVAMAKVKIDKTWTGAKDQSYYQAVGREADQAVTVSQVATSDLTRTNLQRQKGGLVSSLTFMRGARSISGSSILGAGERYFALKDHLRQVRRNGGDVEGAKQEVADAAKGFVRQLVFHGVLQGSLVEGVRKGKWVAMGLLASAIFGSSKDDEENGNKLLQFMEDVATNAAGLIPFGDTAATWAVTFMRGDASKQRRLMDNIGRDLNPIAGFLEGVGKNSINVSRWRSLSERLDTRADKNGERMSEKQLAKAERDLEKIEARALADFIDVITTWIIGIGPARSGVNYYRNVQRRKPE